MISDSGDRLKKSVAETKSDCAAIVIINRPYHCNTMLTVVVILQSYFEALQARQAGQNHGRNREGRPSRSHN